MHEASASGLDAGESELMFQSVAVFTNSSASYGSGPYYDTGGSRTDYNFSAGLGFGLGADFEAGFSLGYGHLNATTCFGGACNSDSIGSRQWSLFLRHNFSNGYDSGDYAFSGIEFSALYSGQLGRITLLRPYVGYRIGMARDWTLELSVGGSQVVSGGNAVSSGYEVRAGLAIPF
ncbi:MAG TPA: hypothetical protein VFX47_00705 [Gammaproteobacteria bacterium]|nr:hypothetical protein [Gammaproteobacteria bacterium]